MSDYRVQLDVFNGPLDLLLFLIRRDEVDIYDIPIARLTAQYLDYVHALEHIDPNAAGEFLVMAAQLVELKSRALLPTPPLDLAPDFDDPRTPLVQRLLEYKRFKDAARALGSAADDRAKRYVRQPGPLPRELEGVELEEASVWDLLAAFSRVMTAIGRGPGVHEVRDDDVTVEQHAEEIVAMLRRDGPTRFESLIGDGEDRLFVIGRFLAMLELIRSRRLRAEQEATFGRIYLFLQTEVECAEVERAEVDPRDGGRGAADQGAGDYGEVVQDVVAQDAVVPREVRLEDHVEGAAEGAVGPEGWQRLRSGSA